MVRIVHVSAQKHVRNAAPARDTARRDFPLRGPIAPPNVADDVVTRERPAYVDFSHPPATSPRHDGYGVECGPHDRSGIPICTVSRLCFASTLGNRRASLTPLVFVASVEYGEPQVCFLLHDESFYRPFRPSRLEPPRALRYPDAVFSKIPVAARYLRPCRTKMTTCPYCAHCPKLCCPSIIHASP